MAHFPATAESQDRRLWRSVLACAVAFILALTLVLPVPASSAGPDTRMSTVTAAPTQEGTSSSDAGAHGLVQHAHCACHSAIRLTTEGATEFRVSDAVPVTARATAPRPTASSPPFKPPRIA